MNNMERIHIFSLICLIMSISSGVKAVDVNENVIHGLVQRIENMEKQISELVKNPCKSQRFVVDSVESPVAFTAAISKTSISNLNPHQTIIFETTMTDIGGGYNNVSGIFVAPRSGVYVFSCSLLDHNQNGLTVHAEIVKGGNAILGRIFARAEENLHRDQGAQTIVTHLKAGDQVWVRIFDSRNLSMGGELYSTFTGYLLYAD